MSTNEAAGHRGDVYVSTDIESDGPIPGIHSMLSLGSAAFSSSGDLIDTFDGNLIELAGATPCPETMRFWESQPAAWEATQVDRRRPEELMVEYREWLQGLPGKPVLVGLPAVFDHAFVNYYLYRFAGGNPFSRNAVDIRSFAMAVLGLGWSDSTFAAMPSAWLDRWEHDHTALGDAMAQGQLFMQMKKTSDAQLREAS